MSQTAGLRKVYMGRLLCVTGIVLAVIGGFFVSIAVSALAVVLGMLGYAMGARSMGRATIILAFVTLIGGLLLGQGVMPGAYDRITNGFFRVPPVSK